MKGRRHLRKCVILIFDLHLQKRGHLPLLRPEKLERACHDLSSDIGYSYMVYGCIKFLKRGSGCSPNSQNTNLLR